MDTKQKWMLILQNQTNKTTERDGGESDEMKELLKKLGKGKRSVKAKFLVTVR